MIKTHNSEGLKIYLPYKMLGVLLAYVHLLGHLGVGRMMKNLESYYYPALYTVVKNLLLAAIAVF